VNKDAEVRSDAIGKEHAASGVNGPQESPRTVLISCPPAGGFGLVYPERSRRVFDQTKMNKREIKNNYSLFG